MRKAKRERLEKKGWKVGSADEFLQLTPEESRYIDLKLRLSHRPSTTKTTPPTIAIGVADPNTFYADFLGTLAGSPVEAGREATADEEAYLKAVEAATANLEAMFEAAFSDPALEAALEGGDYDGAGVAAALDLVLTGVAASHGAVAALSPPPSLQAVHDNFLEVFGLFAERRDEIVSAAEAADSFAFFEEIVSNVPDIADGCDPIAEEAAFLGVDIELFC